MWTARRALRPRRHPPNRASSRWRTARATRPSRAWQQVLARAAPAASRAAASPARSAEVPAFERQAHRPLAPPSAPFNAAAPAGLPPAELARVADHVMRELDHRVLSFRERTGRI